MAAKTSIADRSRVGVGVGIGPGFGVGGSSASSDSGSTGGVGAGGGRRKKLRRKFRVRIGHVALAFFIPTSALLLTASRLLLSNSSPTSPSSSDARSRAGLPPPGVEAHGGGAAAGGAEGNGTTAASKNSFHFVVSSDCTSYQRWETLTQLHSARAVGQCGRFTWIVSGCLSEGELHRGKGRGGAHSDILTPSALLEEVGRHFPTASISNRTAAAGGGAGLGEASFLARHNDDGDEDCNAVHPHVHFTPDFSDMRKYGGPFASGKEKRTFVNRAGKALQGSYGNTYKFMNKPSGLHHWAAHYASINDRRDEAVVLVDPDFLFITKFDLPDGTEPVAPGKPAAAKYGLGTQFLEFNMTRICGRVPFRLAGSNASSAPSDTSSSCPFVSLTNKDVNKYYSAGPPYIIHIQDVLTLSGRWLELVPPTYDEYPLLYAEMFAYSMAAADTGLKHNLIKGLFSGCMTAWPHLKNNEQKALSSSAKAYARSMRETAASSTNTKKGNGGDSGSAGSSSCFESPLAPPPFFHYCQRYIFSTPNISPDKDTGAGDGGDTQNYHFFAKRRVAHDVLDCNRTNGGPMEPFLSDKPEKIDGNKDWNTLAVCAVVRAINFARDQGCSI